MGKIISSLSSTQFMNLKSKTIEKRILAYYEEKKSPELLAKETVLLQILHQLRKDKHTYTPCLKRIRQFYLEKLATGENLFYLGFFRHYFKAYFSAYEWWKLQRFFQKISFFPKFIGKILEIFPLPKKVPQELILAVQLE